MRTTIVLFVFVFATLTVAYGQEIIVDGSTNTISSKLDWLLSNAESGKTYVIILDRDETLSSMANLDYDGRQITLILRGRGAMRRISLTASASSESLFLIRSGVTLILDNNVTLQGSVREALVRVGSGGTLMMNEGSVISGNDDGRGVEVNGGTFTMNGGTITGNSIKWREGRERIMAGEGGGGVFINNNGIFTMNRGTISGNSVYGIGGGVFVDNGTFTMTGGTISGNTTIYDGDFGFWSGAGVHVNGTFIMTGGSISGNTAPVRGGGVSVMGGTFTMTGGSISGNRSEYGGYGGIGGGVFVDYGGIFNLNSPATKSSVSSNSARDYPQVYVGPTATFRVNGLQERGY